MSGGRSRISGGRSARFLPRMSGRFLPKFCSTVATAPQQPQHASSDQGSGVILRLHDVTDVPFHELPPNVKYFDQREIKLITKNFSENIGKGGSSDIYKGNTGNISHDQIQVAVKRIRDDTFIRPWKTEIFTLSKCRFENIVEIIGYSRAPACIVVKFMDGGPLSNYIESKLSWEARIKVAYKISIALAKINDAGIILCDFKSENVLLDKNFIPHIADFGAAVGGGIPDSWNMPQFTHGYSEPEYMRIGNWTEKTDVYSFGILLLDFIMKKHTVTRGFNSRLTAIHTFPHIIHEDFEEQKQYYEEDARSIKTLAMACTSERDNRPTIQEVVHSMKLLRIIHDMENDTQQSKWRRVFKIGG